MDSGSISIKQIRLLNIAVSVSSLLLLGGGYAVKGLDFSKGVLLGLTVVVINYFGLIRIIRKMVSDQKIKAIHVIAHIVWFMLSVGILFCAVYFLHINPIGIAFGLSAIFIATIVFLLLWVMK